MIASKLHARSRVLRLLPALVLLLPALLGGIPRAGAEETEAARIVAGWVAAVKRGERVYPGGRQRDLLERKAAEILPLLVQAFADEDSRVGHRLAPVAALAPEDPGVAILSKALEDRQGFVPEYAGAALGGIGSPRAIPALCTALRKGTLSPETAFAALREIGGPASEQALLALLSAYTPAMRAMAAEALGSFGGPGVARALRKALGDGVPDVRKAALRALRTAGRREDVEAVVPFLKDEDPENRLAAVAALRTLGGDTARNELERHFTAGRGERLEAIEGALALGASLGPAGAAFAIRLLEDEAAPAIRARAARLLLHDDREESRDALGAALEREKDAGAALAVAEVLLRRAEASVALPAVRGLLERFPERRLDVLVLLDRAGDPQLPDRLRATAADPDAPAGGPLALLALLGGPEDARRALALAREHPRGAGLLADAYLVAAVAGGPAVVEEMAKSLHRLPAEDAVVVVEGPSLPGLRWLHVLDLRILTGHVFGYAPQRPDAENRDAFRKVLRWWMESGTKGPEHWADGAVEEGEAWLADEVPERREAALRVLARVGRPDDLARLASSDPSPSVRVAAARWLVEAGDPRGPARLVESFDDPALLDWGPIPDAPRPTRVEAAEALWRAANRQLEYRAEAYGEDVHDDLVREEGRRWRLWWAAEGSRGPEAWFREGCRLAGIDLGASKEDEMRALVEVLRGEHPRFLKENALARLRALAGRRILPLEIPDLAILAPGETHPIFALLANRWAAAAGGSGGR